MPPGRLPREVFQACPTGRRPRGRPRTRWRNYVSRLAWERLGVPPEELEEVSGELNRMRSRSVSRRSAPSSSAVEGSLSRMRSRSAHREQDFHSWLTSQTLFRQSRSWRQRAVMEYLGDKLSVAHSQVTGWVGNVRRSLHGAFSLLSSTVERGGRGEDGTGDFKRTNSLRSLASRSRESIRRFSLRSQQRLSLRRRTAPNTPTAVQQKQSVSGEEEGKDSETLVRETDSQYGTWETGLRSEDSLTPATPSSESILSPSPRKPTPPHTPGDHASQSDADTLDSLPPSSSSESQSLSFPDAPDHTVRHLRFGSRAQLGKKRAPRTRPSRSARQSTEGEGGTAEDWLYRDSTEAKAESKGDDSDSEEQTRGADASPAVSSQPQRVPLFPGMDPSALKAQLKKRGDSDNQIDGPTPSPSQLSRSPKSPFLPRAARVLPPPGGKENGEEDSPQWLKELKSKKRLSQYENES
ncbi:hypothetical protein L3Q82_022820 [Scortum barcoo]|uniref:Uncharacterized protein n=1 Tax=Scortum barcoo TaxID=214431 RepID=A0ACB8WX70_9TELE|nr:hypothetical protein L3Q82_022820 [Scortum barcoo]